MRRQAGRRTAAAAWLLVASSLAVVFPTVPAEASTTAPGFQLVDELGGLDRPVAVEFASDGRVFVAEKDGKLKVFDGLSDTQPDVVIDWRNKIMSNLDRGLLGLAVDPQFGNGRDYVYLFYTYDAPPGQNNAPVHGDDCGSWETTGCTVTAKLARIEVGPNNTMIGSEHMLLEDKWCLQFTSHSNGDLEFGPDGALYVSAGEGASFVFVDHGQNGGNPCHDPPFPNSPSSSNSEGGALRAQDILTSVGGEGNDPVWLNGSVLRINPDTGAAAPGNPLLGGPVSGDDRVIAHGLRNPYRFAFRPGTNEIWLGDVGWYTWEEVNRIADATDGLVENFGWPCYEGPQTHGGYASLGMCDRLLNGSLNPVVDTALTSPFFSYRHSDALAGCAPASSSVSGIAFEDGSNYPASFDGALFIADYSRGCVWAMQVGGDGVPDPSRISTIASGVRPVDLERGPGGDLFIVDPDNFQNGGGRILRLRHLDANGAPSAVAAVDPTSGSVGSTVFQFDAGGSTDPDGDPLTYQWDFDGNGQFDAGGITVTHSYAQPGTYTARLRASDPSEAYDEATVVVNVSNSPPVVTITSPASTSTWRVGDTISFSGTATDAEDGTLSPNTPGREWEWTVILHHCPSECHQHIEASWNGIGNGTFPVPDHEYPSYLEFTLTVEDGAGATTTARVEVQPQSSVVKLRTDPIGLPLIVSSRADPTPTPFDLPSLVGSQITVSAPRRQTVAGISYEFRAWSDEGTASHDITVPGQDLTLTAEYVRVSAAQPGLVDAGGRWHLPDEDGVVQSFYFGVPGDYALVGDWDCDGVDTPGLYRQSDGLAYLRNSNSTGMADISFIFGDPGDIPIVGDFDGDGCDTLSVYRQSRVFIINQLGTNGGSLGAADYDYWFGIPGDVPFTGDFDADGIDELGLFREDAGLVYFTLNHPPSGAAVTDNEFFYGNPGDKIIAGDWTNDGTDTVGIYRPTNSTFYLRYTNTLGNADEVIVTSAGSWPVAGSFTLPR